MLKDPGKEKVVRVGVLAVPDNVKSFDPSLLNETLSMSLAIESFPS